MTTVYADCTQARARMRARASAYKDVAREPLANAAMTAANAARATTSFRDKTGKTRGSIRDVRGPLGNQSSVVARGAAVFLESGTGRYGLRGRDYVITPKRGKFLAFQIAGRWIHATHVVHPGIKATHFMFMAAEFARSHFTELCVHASHQAVAGR